MSVSAHRKHLRGRPSAASTCSGADTNRRGSEERWGNDSSAGGIFSSYRKHSAEMPQRLMGGFDRRWRDMAVKNSSCRLLPRLFVFLSSSIPSSPPPPLCLFPLLRSHLPRSGSAAGPLRLRSVPPSWKPPGSPRTSCFQEAPVHPNFPLMPAGGGGQTVRGARRRSPHSWDS